MRARRLRNDGERSPPTQERRVAEWRRFSLQVVAGLLVFETLSGLAIWLLPFSVGTQMTVLVHTVVGVAFLLPYAWYQIRHWRLYRTHRLTHVKLTGYLSMVATTVAAVTGCVLTAQALFGTRIGYGWDVAHIVSTFAVVAAVVPHVVAKLVHNARGTGRWAEPARRAERRFGVRSGLMAAGSALLVVVLAVAYRPVDLQEGFPEGYSLRYGADRPFAPSLARTASGGALDPQLLGGSAACGSSGCHEQILREWQASAHRYSAMDPAFRAVQGTMAERNGPVSTRYCAGCHDPISLFAGTKDLFREDLTHGTGYDEGVSCVTCHAIRETDVKGNADYVVDPPRRYVFELRDGPAAKAVSDFLIRAYPDHHVESLSHRRFKTPEFCGACHKQFIDEEINQVGWVQLQNQYDSWRKSRWNHPGEADRTIECRECHMRLLESRDPARGDAEDYNRTPDDGKHRSHRFLAANQFIPSLLDLPGAEEHVRLTERWLRGEIEVPEIADKWRSGPVVPLEIVAPDAVAPGDQVRVTTTFTNHKAGHNFPTGPMDIIQAWVHLRVTVAGGRVVHESGALDEDGFVQPGSFIFKAEPVDQYGNLIDRHNLWEMVGVRYARALFPGFSDRAEYSFTAPSRARTAAVPGDGGEAAAGSSSPSSTALVVEARLLYRKFNQSLLDFVLPDAGLTAPATVISTARDTIRVTAGAPAGPAPTAASGAAGAGATGSGR